MEPDEELTNFRAKSKHRVERATRIEADPLEYDVRSKRTWAWKLAERLATKAENEAIQLSAIREFLKRTDPEPQREPTTVNATFNAPVVIRWDLSAPEIPPPSALTEPKNTFSNGSSDSTSSSVIADGERPPSASTT
jgi:hypothetical protein